MKAEQDRWPKQPRHDIQVVEHADVAELDPELVAGFLARERAISPRVFSGLSDEDALLTMGVTARGADGAAKPTLAGLMALGRHPQKHFPRANVTFAVFPGASKEDLAHDGARFLDSRTIIGPVPVMVAETLAAVRRNMKTASYVEEGARRDVAEYPQVAIREAVANALMHRDYSPEGIGSQVQVNMYADHIEVVSPGGLFGAVTVDNIGTYGASSSRNQYLSRILESAPYPAGYPEKGYVVENKGTGFAQIQAALKECGMAPAEPKDSLSLFVVTMRKRTDDSDAGSGATPGAVNAAAEKAERGETGAESAKTATAKTAHAKTAKPKAEHEAGLILNEVNANGSVSTSEVSALLGVSAATAYRKIKEMVGEGILQPTGRRGRSTRYARG